jgi:ornithine cyclodeaminase/alanine dehydrogenase-like protein (mu-crystallin family)
MHVPDSSLHCRSYTIPLLEIQHSPYPTLGSILATVLLHPPETASFRQLVVFGAGLQIKAHIRQLLASYPSIDRITIFNRQINDRLNALVDDLSRAYPAVMCDGLSSADRAVTEEIVGDADIIRCATPSTAPLFPSDWVRPGTHIILVGSYTPEMAEVDGALIRRARVVLVDSRSACAQEAGELIAAGIPQTRIVEVGELLRAPGIVQDDVKSWGWEPDAQRVAEVLSAGTGDVTIFKSVGIGAQDVAISVATVDRAREMGIGTVLLDFEDGSGA